MKLGHSSNFMNFTKYYPRMILIALRTTNRTLKTILLYIYNHEVRIRQTLSEKEKGTRVVQIIDIISTVQYEHTCTGTVIFLSAI